MGRPPRVRITRQEPKPPDIGIDRISMLQRILDYPHELGHILGKTKLTELHSQWIRDMWLPEESTFILAHRGSYKTTSCDELAIIWRWLFHPDRRIALLRETWTVACQTQTVIRKHLENPALRHIFHLAHGGYPKALTKNAGHLLYSFKKTNTKENSLDAYGISQIPTGSHYDEVVMDDVVTINDRVSKAKRDATKMAVQEVLNNILDPGCPARIIGTPWHPEDAYEMKGEDGARILPTPMRYDCYSTGILTPEQIERVKSRSTKSMFAANQLLVHMADESRIFKDPTYGPWELRLDAYAVVGQIDAKYHGSDTGAVTVMARRPDGKIQARGWRFTEHVDTMKAEIRTWLMQYRCARVRCERNGDKGYLERDLGVLVGDRMQVEGYDERMNKHIKIASYLLRYWRDIIWDPETDPEYMNQILDYQEGEEPDDAPDSAASLLRDAFYPQDEASTAQYEALYGD